MSEKKFFTGVVDVSSLCLTSSSHQELSYSEHTEICSNITQLCIFTLSVGF